MRRIRGSQTGLDRSGTPVRRSRRRRSLPGEWWRETSRQGSAAPRQDLAALSVEPKAQQPLISPQELSTPTAAPEQESPLTLSEEISVTYADVSQVDEKITPEDDKDPVRKIVGAISSSPLTTIQGTVVTSHETPTRDEIQPELAMLETNVESAILSGENIPPDMSGQPDQGCPRPPSQGPRSLSSSIPQLLPAAPRKKGKRPSTPNPSSRTGQATYPFEFKTPSPTNQHCAICNQKECACLKPAEADSPPVSRELSECLLLAKTIDLKHRTIPSSSGFVKIATGIALHSKVAGEIRIPSRSSTGVRRALRGDEFYVVRQGFLICDVGSRRVQLCAGDMLAIPENNSFEIRNPTALETAAVFFCEGNLD